MTYDAVVVGAGVGGLVAAGVMARAGRRVLVLERSRHPGGTSYVFRRGAYTFPMGPLGFSSPNLVTSAFARMNAAPPGADRAFATGHSGFDRIRYRLRAFGLDLNLSRRLADVATDLASSYPGDASGIHIFCEQAQAISRALDHPDGERERTLLGQAAKIPARDYLKDVILNPTIRRVLGSLGTSEPSASLVLVAAMWRLMSEQGIWSLEQGMGQLGDSLLAAATAAGAEVRLGAEVEAIRVTDGRALGVTLAGGEEINAAAVVSNADYKTTFLRLISDEHISDEFFQAVFYARQTDSALQVALGVEAADLSAFDDCDRIIYRRREEGPGPEWRAVEIDPHALAGEELEISLLSRPAAGSTAAALVIRVPAEYGHFTRYRIAARTRRPNYAPYKQKLAAALMAEAEQVVPGLVAAARVIDVATPLTFEDRGGRSAGAIAGWSWDYKGMSDPAPRELVKTPIAGLYMAGCQAFSGLHLGGVPTAALSGIRAAEAVIDGAGPETPRLPG